MSGMTKAKRLNEMKRLYKQRAYSDIKMAERLGVSRETVFRDRVALTDEEHYPIEKNADGLYFMNRSKLLSEIKVSLHEALALYLSARKTSRQTHFRHIHAISAMEKLAAILYKPMAEKLLKATDAALQQEENQERIKIIEDVTQAWTEQREVRIEYLALGRSEIVKHTLRPYLIEPSIWSDSVYVIAYSNKMKTVAPFKIERIKYTFLSGATFELPADFDEEALLKHAWGIWYQDKAPVTVKLRFTPKAAQRVKESKWHPLEKVEDIEDGGCIWQADLAEWREMLPWVRGWGADVEALAPEGLRKALIREARLLVGLYGVGKMEKELIAHVRERDKEIQTLEEHLAGVSRLAGQFADKIGLKEIGQILGWLHDVGKASQEFQNYIGSATGLIQRDTKGWVDFNALKGKVDHSTAGAQVIYGKLKEDGSKAGQALALCVASHHSGLIDCLAPDGENNFQKRIEKEDSKTHVKETWEKLPEIEKKVNELLSVDLERQMLDALNGLKSLPESKSSQQVQYFKYGLLARYLLSCLIDADRLDTADFEFPSNYHIRNYGNYRSWEELISRLDTKLLEFKNKADKNEVDKLRQEVSQACFDFSSRPKGIYQLTVPTGGGKTLSSLRFALSHAKTHGMDRIFYIIPYTSIIDQNADTVRQILEDKDEDGQYLNKVVLEHHSNIIEEENEDDKKEEESWLPKKRRDLLSQNWDAPIVFTTQVQFLEALFGSGTRSVRRMHQLANSVIIFDEVQTIPIRVMKMFNVALQFLVQGGKSSIVLCTATQPLLDKIEPEEYALKIDGRIVADKNALYEKLRRVEVFDQRKNGTSWNEDEVAQLASQELSEKGSVLVIVNTKKSAKSLYDAILAKDNDVVDIYHLSTRMCPAHRLKVLGEIKNKLDKEEPLICVSTQLIEAGVDIDFGAVIRYQAGLDSIAQAAGRCNRSGKQEDEKGNRVFGHVHIIEPANENIDRLKDIKEGVEIIGRVLRDFERAPEKYDNDRLGLKSMELYYQYYFYARNRNNVMEYPVGSNSPVMRSDETLFNLLAQNKMAANRYTKDKGTPPFFSQAFSTASKEFKAIDSPTKGVIVQYGKKGKRLVSELCSAFELEKQYELIKKAQRYSVNLFSYEFEKMTKAGIIREVQQGAGIYYLDEQYYSEEVGWSEEKVNNMDFLNM